MFLSDKLAKLDLIQAIRSFCVWILDGGIREPSLALFWGAFFQLLKSLLIELRDRTHTDEQSESVQLTTGKLYAGWTGDIRSVCDGDEGPGAQKSSQYTNYRRQNTQSKKSLLRTSFHGV